LARYDKSIGRWDKPTPVKRLITMNNLKLSHSETASLLTAAIVLAVLGIAAI
jgi:hypothetical protein